MSRLRKETLAVAVSAMLLAIGVALKFLTIQVPMGGAPMMDIWLGGVFVNYIAVLFGPFYGAIAGPIADILGFFLKGAGGAYMWEMSLVAAVKGGLIGFIWVLIRKSDLRKLTAVYVPISFGVMVLGIVNLIFLNYMPETVYGAFLKTAGNRADYLSVGLTILGTCCLAMWFLRPVFEKMLKKEDFSYYLKVFAAIIVPSLLGTAVNTFILLYRNFVTASGGVLIYLLPRLVDSALMSVYNTLMILIFIRLTPKQLLLLWKNADTADIAEGAHDK
jgi:uncharacterized membrane protein